MSSYATVYLSDGREICSFRNDVDDLFFMLFTTADRIELDGEDAYRLTGLHYSDQWLSDAVEADEDDADEDEFADGQGAVTVFRTTVFALRERLDVTGFDLAAVSSELKLRLA